MPSSRLVFLGSRQNAGDAIVVANPATRSCRAYGLPQYAAGAVTGLALNGERVAYAYDSGNGKDRMWVGALGHRFRNFRAPPLTAGPVWAGGRVAWASGRRIVFAGGGSISPHLPRRAAITELSAKGHRFAVYAGGALYVVEGARTTRLETEPFPAAEAPGPVWSPDGSRIAVLRNGDLWTIPVGRGRAIRVSRGRPPSAPGGGLSSWIWSPGSRSLAYASFAGRPRRTVVFVQPATGGRRRAVVRGRELFPLAWRRNTLAVQTGRGIGLVSTRGGAIEPLCRRFWPFVRAGSSVSWLAR